MFLAPRSLDGHALKRSSKSDDGVQVDVRGDDLYFLNRELLSLRDDFSVHRYARASVIIKPASVAASLVRVQVDPASLSGRGLDKVHPSVQFSKLMVTAASITDDLNAAQGELDVRRVWREQLLARFAR